MNMNGFYLRWVIILLMGALIASFGFWRYQREVASLSPAELLQEKPTGGVRVLGTVKPGTLVQGKSPGEAWFELTDAKHHLTVYYTGPEDENLRELKTLVVVGQWDAGSSEFQARELAVVPNYGFITSAYIVSIIPIGLFLFVMERRIRLLYADIKGTTVYEPEKIFDAEQVV
jgi:cytochrome c-type biogenesis protein CcmE